MVVGLGCGGDEPSSNGTGGADGGPGMGGASGGLGGTPGAGGTAAGADAGMGMGTVMITVGGALTGTRTGDAPALSYSPTNDTTDLLFATVTDGPFLASFAFTFTGKPMVASYTQDSASVTCTVGVGVPNTTHAWQARKGIMLESDAGECALTFTSLVDQGSNGITEIYEAHGTVTGTLLPRRDGDAQGMVTATFTF